MFNHAALLLLALIGATSGLYAEEIDVPFVVENACPFEGCTFGKWTVLKDTTVFQRPEKKSPIVGTLKAGTSVSVVSGIEYVTPGKAIVIGKPYSHEKIIDPDEEILILNYQGEGRSQVFHNGQLFITKIARKKSRCSDNSNWRYCWVKVIQEPISIWWVEVKNMGWVSMEQNALKAIDALSNVAPYNKCLKQTRQSRVA